MKGLKLENAVIPAIIFCHYFHYGNRHSWCQTSVSFLTHTEEKYKAVEHGVGKSPKQSSMNSEATKQEAQDPTCSPGAHPERRHWVR